MTNPTECLAAKIGLLIAENDPKLHDYDKSSQNLSGFEAVAYENSLDDAYDAYSHLTMALSHVRATSMDGAAAQVAAALNMKTRIAAENSNDDTKEEVRAIHRLLHSALYVMMDRVEADKFEPVIDALAPMIHDPWTPPFYRVTLSENELSGVRPAAVAAE